MYPLQIIFGSESDRGVADDSGMFDILPKLGIKWQLNYISAHRNKKNLKNFCERALQNGVKVIIAAAGMMPALPGDVASWTKAMIPVIGVVLDSSTILGKDTVATASAMPKGIPVLIGGIGKYGLANAVIAAVQILATSDKDLRKKLDQFYADNIPEAQEKVESSDTYEKEGK